MNNANDLNLSRSEVFHTLAAFWLKPEQESYIEITSQESLYHFINLISETYHISVDSLDFLKSFPTFEEHAKNYEQLFSLSFGKLAAPLFESVYKKWTENPKIKTPQAHQTGYVKGDSYSYMKALLHQLEIELPDEYQADELPIILDVYALLIEYAPVSSIKNLSENHLDWLDELSSRLARVVTKRGFGEFYLDLLALTQSLVELEHKLYLP